MLRSVTVPEPFTLMSVRSLKSSTASDHEKVRVVVAPTPRDEPAVVMVVVGGDAVVGEGFRFVYCTEVASEVLVRGGGDCKRDGASGGFFRTFRQGELCPIVFPGIVRVKGESVTK